MWPIGPPDRCPPSPTRLRTRLISAGFCAAGDAPCRGLLRLLDRSLSVGSVLVVAFGAVVGVAIALLPRALGRRRRRYRRLELRPYRTDRAGAEALVAMFEALHQQLLEPWWRRAIFGQPSVALEVHVDSTRAGGRRACLAVSCPRGLEAAVQACLRSAYPHLRLRDFPDAVVSAPWLARLRKRHSFIRRLHVLESGELEDPLLDRLLSAMATGGGAGVVQIALTPAPPALESWARRLHRRHEALLGRVTIHDGRARRREPSQVEDRELQGGLDVQHRALFFGDLRVLAHDRRRGRQIAAELCAQGAENRLVTRTTWLRHRVLGAYGRRLSRGEGNRLPDLHRGVYASTELAALWHLPSVGFSAVPFTRGGVPVAPASPGVHRPRGPSALRDELGAVAIEVDLRRQNTAVPGTVEQGKSSYLVGTVAEDMGRPRCAIVLLDPKGDAADAAISQVPPQRVCTVLDLARPTCGFNPLRARAAPDVVADHVVAALRHLFSEGDIRASSDRYLRNAIIAVLAHEPRPNLYDVARLLSVTREGVDYRRRVGERVTEIPELKEIADFFSDELAVQLDDARSMTTAKLDAPANKLARVLNSASIKRVLLNHFLVIDFDRIIAGGEVLVVKGALGRMGPENTAVVMQLLVGMLDAALARQQDETPAADRVAVALKIDEAPLVINRGFAQTLALKRSAGLETVACWQADAQWTEPELREQLDALFAHRVYFATASATDARAGAGLLMAEFSDRVSPALDRASWPGSPDVRLHLPRHFAVASFTTRQGRQPPFIAQTRPLAVDAHRIAHHAAVQAHRGGRHLDELRQPPPRHEVARAASSAPRPPAAETLAPAGSPVPVPALRPRVPASSYAELVALDGATRVRWDTPPPVPEPGPEPSRAATSRPPSEGDRALLSWLVAMGCALASQAHRGQGAGRDLSSTQRRLKRLHDAGWVGRCQLHRDDGGGVPMCYWATAAGRALSATEPGASPRSAAPAGASRLTDVLSRGASPTAELALRRGAHLTGWLLAAQQVLEAEAIQVHPRAAERLTPPPHGGRGATGPIGPAQLTLPDGRRPHGFRRTPGDGSGARLEVKCFEALEPGAVVELRSGRGQIRVDLLVVWEARRPCAHVARQLERCDHLLAGWWRAVPRYARHLEAPPLVVVVCPNFDRAQATCALADDILTSCEAYAGQPPAEWRHPGRERIAFGAERDVHEGRLVALGVPLLPPALRHADTEEKGEGTRRLKLSASGWREADGLR